MDNSKVQRLINAVFPAVSQIMAVKVKKFMQLVSNFPHLLERQSVNLALKIFSHTNAAALKYFGPSNENLENWEGTATFIMLVWRWWCCVNVKHSFKGRNTLNDYARPIDKWS